MLLLDNKENLNTTSDMPIERAVVRKTSLEVWTGEWLRQILLFPLTWLFARPRVYGREHLKGAGPYIFAANHASHLDAPLMLLALPLRLRLRLRVAAAADYFFASRWKGALVSMLFNAFPFERRGGSGSAASLDCAQRLLRDGYSILIFPEGTRTRTGLIQPFKRGVGTLALSMAAPIVPVWIEGTYAAFPRGARLPRFHRVSISFGAPLTCLITDNPSSVACEVEQQVRLLASSAPDSRLSGSADQHQTPCKSTTEKTNG